VLNLSKKSVREYIAEETGAGKNGNFSPAGFKVLEHPDLSADDQEF
jgi:hypothetical protein